MVLSWILYLPLGRAALIRAAARPVPQVGTRDRYCSAANGSWALCEPISSVCRADFTSPPLYWHYVVCPIWRFTAGSLERSGAEDALSALFSSMSHGLGCLRRRSAPHFMSPLRICFFPFKLMFYAAALCGFIGIIVERCRGRVGLQVLRQRV